MSTPTDSEILAVAAELLENGPGWCKGKMYDDEGRMCMLGAIGMAAEHRPRPLTDEVFRFLPQCAGMWNDQQESVRPVIKALRRAARLSAKKGF